MLSSSRSLWTRLIGYIPPRLTFSERLRRVLTSTLLGWLWDVLQLVATLVSCCAYVYSTYFPFDDGFGLIFFEWLTTVLFLLDLVVRWVAAASPLLYLFSAHALTDIFNVVPTIVQLVATGSLSSSAERTLRIFRIIRVFRVLRAFRIIQRAAPLARQAFHVALVIFSLVFILAGVLQLVESDLGPELGHAEAAARWDFSRAFYFGVVTVSTVGFGDFFPLTEMGRAVTAVFIILCLIIVPREINKFAAMLSHISRYRKPFPRSRWLSTDDPPHVLVVGAVTSPAVVRNFLAQFYHCSYTFHDVKTASSPMCVIMGTAEPSAEIRDLLINPALEERVMYIKGSVLVEEDMLAAGADIASTIFVICDQRAAATAQGTEDAASALAHADRTASLIYVMCRALAPRADIFVSLNRLSALSILAAPEPAAPPKRVGSWPRTEALVFDEWTQKTVAGGAVFPGFPALISGLTSATLAPARLPASTPPWLLAHARGASSKVVAVAAPAAFDGQSFTAVAAAFYEASRGSAMAWGVASAPDGDGDWSARAPRRARRRSALSTTDANLSGGAGDAWDVTGGFLPGSVEERVRAEAAAAPPSAISGLQLIVPGELIFNPGAFYRVRAGETLVLLVADDVWLPSLVEPKAWASVSLPPTLGAAGRSRPGAPAGYGFPTAHEDDVWSWGTHGEMHTRVWADWFGDYDARPHSAQPGARGQSRGGVQTPARAKAREVWARVAAHIRSRALELARKRGLRASIAAAESKFEHASARAQRIKREHLLRSQRARRGKGDGGSDDGDSGAGDALDAAAEGDGAFHSNGRSRSSAAAGGLRSAAADDAQSTRAERAEVLSTPFAFVQRWQLVRDVRVDMGEGGGPVGHIIIAASGAHLIGGFLTSLRSSHTRGTPLSKMVVFLLRDFVDEQRTHDALVELRALGTCAVVVGDPTRSADLERAGIATASCLVLLDNERPAREAVTTEPAMPLRPGEDAGDSGFVGTVEAFDDASRIFSFILVERALASIETSPTLRLLISVASSSCLPAINAHTRRFKLLGAAEIGGRAEIAAIALAAEEAAKAEARLSEGRPGRGFAGGDGDDMDEDGGAEGEADDVALPTAAPARVAADGDALVEGILGAAGAAALRPSKGEIDAAAATAAHCFSSTHATSHLLPVFAAGAVAVRSYPASVSVASFYSPTGCRVAEALLSPNPDLGSRLVVEPLPRRFHGRTFGALVADMRTDARYRAPLPIALYRPHRAVSAPLDVFILHPKPDTVLVSAPDGEDLVYFLALQPVFLGRHATSPGELDPFVEALCWTSHPVVPGAERENSRRREAVKRANADSRGGVAGGAAPLLGRRVAAPLDSDPVASSTARARAGSGDGAPAMTTSIRSFGDAIDAAVLHAQSSVQAAIRRAAATIESAKGVGVGAPHHAAHAAPAVHAAPAFHAAPAVHAALAAHAAPAARAAPPAHAAPQQPAVVTMRTLSPASMLAPTPTGRARSRGSAQGSRAASSSSRRQRPRSSTSTVAEAALPATDDDAEVPSATSRGRSAHARDVPSALSSARRRGLSDANDDGNDDDDDDDANRGGAVFAPSRRSPRGNTPARKARAEVEAAQPRRAGGGGAAEPLPRRSPRGSTPRRTHGPDDEAASAVAAALRREAVAASAGALAAATAAEAARRARRRSAIEEIARGLSGPGAARRRRPSRGPSRGPSQGPSPSASPQE